MSPTLLSRGIIPRRPGEFPKYNKIFFHKYGNFAFSMSSVLILPNSQKANTSDIFISTLFALRWRFCIR